MPGFLMNNRGGPKKTATTTEQRSEQERAQTFQEALAEMVSRAMRTTDVFGQTTGTRAAEETLFGTTAEAGTAAQRGTTLAREAATTRGVTEQSALQQALARMMGTTTGTTGTEQQVAREFVGLEALPPELQNALLNSIFGLSDLARPATPGTFPPEVFEAAARPIIEQFQEVTIPSLRQRAASAGQLFGPRLDVLEERAGRGLTRELGDIQARLIPAAQQLQQAGTVQAGETLRGLAGTIFAAPAARETITGATQTAEQRAMEEARTLQEARTGVETRETEATRAAEEARVAESQRTVAQQQQRTSAERVMEETIRRSVEQSVQEEVRRQVLQQLMERELQARGTSTTTQKTKPGLLEVVLGLGRLGLGAFGQGGPFGVPFGGGGEPTEALGFPGRVGF